MSLDGRIARDAMLGLMKPCMKLGISFFTYVGNRLGADSSQPSIPPLDQLIAHRA
jgi:hypothetical protein